MTGSERESPAKRETVDKDISSRPRDTIEIGEPKIINGQRVTHRLRGPRSVENFLLEDSFWAEYDVRIEDLPPSILAIPCVSNVVLIAWALGADLKIAQIDQAFAESLEKVCTTLRGFYPGLPFKTRIFASRVSNSYASDRTALLFGAGVDSLASYVRHRQLHPTLIGVLGADIPLEEKAHWESVKKRNEGFAIAENLTFRTAASNLRAFLDQRFLIHEFRKKLHGRDWWGGLQQGLGMAGLCAPICARDGISQLLISATHTKSFKSPEASHPLIDNNIRMGSTKVVHDGYDLSRQEKIRHILKREIEDHPSKLPFRVCNSIPRSALNCSHCEKCARTIVGLILEDIDPRTLGFSVNHDTLGDLRSRLESGAFELTASLKWHWNDIQRHIPPSLDHDLYGARTFFMWFRSFDIENSRGAQKAKSNDPITILIGLHYRVPKTCRTLLQDLYRRARTRGLGVDKGPQVPRR